MTVQKVFDMAIHLMDEQNESTGQTATTDTEEYKFRTISILNTVIQALYPYSGNYDNSVQGRPFAKLLELEDFKNPDFSQQIDLDEPLCASLLPYYLAAQLLSGENEDLASWFMARYRDIFMDIRGKIPASFERIGAPYGLF